jgi:hypothetical protein
MCPCLDLRISCLSSCEYTNRPSRNVRRFHPAVDSPKRSNDDAKKPRGPSTAAFRIEASVDGRVGMKKLPPIFHAGGVFIAE